MPLIIDTYNVLHTVGILPPELAGIEIEGLVTLLSTSRYAGERITLVCDGNPGDAHRKVEDRGMAISLRFAGHGKPADDLISQLVNLSSAPRRVAVVSSDHAVQRSARRRKCLILTSEEFLEHLATDARLARGDRLLRAAPAKPPGAMTERQVDGWLKVFQIDDDTAAISSGEALPTREMKDQKEADPAPVTSIDAHEQQQPREDDDLSCEQDVADSEAAEDESQPLEAPPRDRRAILPESLIEQAERMWKREVRSTRPPAPPPQPSLQTQPQAESVPTPDQPASESPQSPEFPEELDQLDMGRILPDDGRTKRWKRAADDRKPPGKAE